MDFPRSASSCKCKTKHIRPSTEGNKQMIRTSTFLEPRFKIETSSDRTRPSSGATAHTNENQSLTTFHINLSIHKNTKLTVDTRYSFTTNVQNSKMRMPH